MWTDPIVDELHKIREEHARKFGNDLQAIFADFKEREVLSERPVVTLPIKRRLTNHATRQKTVDVFAD